MTKDEIIECQTEIIEEYTRTSSFISKVCMNVIKTYKNKKDRTAAETEFMNFAWGTNDCLVDQPRIYELMKRLESQ